MLLSAAGSLELDQQENNGLYRLVPGSAVSVTLPAQLELVAVFGATVREYCATLPHIFNRDHLAGPGLGSMLRRTDESQSPGSVEVLSQFVYSIELILQETVTNIIRHGYGGKQPDPLIRLWLCAVQARTPGSETYRRALVMQIIDAAPPFDPTVLPWQEPDPAEPRESGYGLYLINKLADRVSYSYRDGLNRLQVVKYLDPA